MVQTIFTKSHIRKAFLALGPVSFIAGVSMTIGGILYENAAVAMAGYIVMLVSTILFLFPVSWIQSVEKMGNSRLVAYSQSWTRFGAC